MDKHIQKLLRDYTQSPTDELAHKISHAILRSREPSTEMNMYCPNCHSMQVFSVPTDSPGLCTNCGWESSEGFKGTAEEVEEAEEEWEEEECPRCEAAIDGAGDLRTTEEDEEGCVHCYDSDEECCAACGNSLWNSGQWETWAFVSEATADRVEVDGGSMVCLECLQEVGIYDLGDAAED
jgi:hypothetical protein